jgi:hypothetical protein
MLRRTLPRCFIICSRGCHRDYQIKQGYLACKETSKYTYKLLVGKPEGEEELGALGTGWREISKSFTEVRCEFVACIHLTRNVVQWWAQLVAENPITMQSNTNNWLQRIQLLCRATQTTGYRESSYYAKQHKQLVTENPVIVRNNKSQCNGTIR